MPRNHRLSNHHIDKEGPGLIVKVGRAGTDYKNLFSRWIDSHECICKNASLKDILASITCYAQVHRLPVDVSQMNGRSLGQILALASVANASRVLKGPCSTWSVLPHQTLPLLAPPPSMSSQNVVTSKAHITKLRRESAEFKVICHMHSNDAH